MGSRVRERIGRIKVVRHQETQVGLVNRIEYS